MKKFVISLVIMLFIFGSFTTNEKGFSISPHINFEDFSINEEGEYSTIEIEGCNYIHHAGYPMLPYYTKVYTFPAGTKINFVEVKAKNVETIHINKKIVPAMPPLPLNMQTNEYKIEEGEIYEKDEFYPSDWFDYNIGMGIKNGKHVVFLSIH
ncbi:MAG TPA: hypothetical protein ENI52_01665, partial [Thermoplasmata archaeon]|nr:hypothetical protein [Thermoplasmata archaeon]